MIDNPWDEKNAKKHQRFLSRKIERHLEKCFKCPNMYKFLTDRGVSDEIAEEAMEFVHDQLQKGWEILRDQYATQGFQYFVPLEEAWRELDHAMSEFKYRLTL